MPVEAGIFVYFICGLVAAFLIGYVVGGWRESERRDTR
jgi:hypothetical protein